MPENTRFIRMGCAVAAAVALILASCTTSEPDPSPTSSLVEDELHERLANYGVSEVDRASLIADFNAGRVWDSMRSDAEPVSVEEADDDGAWTQIRRFEDGSVRASGLEESMREGDFDSFPLRPCQHRYSADVLEVSNCEVYEDAIVVFGSFRADFWQDETAEAAEIMDARTPSVRVVGGSMAGPEVAVTRADFSPPTSHARAK